MGGGFTGGCACGKVRYVCEEPPIVEVICHCRDCQRASGSAFAAVAIVASDRLRFTGAHPKHHAVKAESGRVMERAFCGDCGSPVSIRKPAASNIAFVHAASFDEPSRFSPSCEVWVSSANPWQQFHEATQKFEKSPSPEAVRVPIDTYFTKRSSS